MFCKNCGSQLIDGALFCANCGAKITFDEAVPSSDDSGSSSSDPSEATNASGTDGAYNDSNASGSAGAYSNSTASGTTETSGNSTASGESTTSDATASGTDGAYNDSNASDAAGAYSNSNASGATGTNSNSTASGGFYQNNQQNYNNAYQNNYTGGAPYSNGQPPYNNSVSYHTIARYVSAGFAVIFAWFFLKNFGSGIRGFFASIFSMFHSMDFGFTFPVAGFFHSIFTIILAACYAGLALFMFESYRTFDREHAKNLCLSVTATGIITILVALIRMLFTVSTFFGFFINYLPFVWALIFVGGAIACLYIFAHLDGGIQLSGGPILDEIKLAATTEINELQKFFQSLTAKPGMSADATGYNGSNYQNANGGMNNNMNDASNSYNNPNGNPNGAPYGNPNGAPYGNPNGAPYGNPNGAPYGNPNGAPYGNPNGAPYGNPGMPPQRLRTDYSLLAYILLGMVTCGIYPLYVIHCIARDMNITGDGDGEHTNGLLMLILLSTITCGIYGWIYWYKFGNRQAHTAPRYGMTFQENGTTVLLWMVLGSMLFGVGPFIAMYILLRNTNALNAAYNQRNGFYY
ncbi:zinc-ribbon domain-containing protein [Lachnospiraceae bacterium KHCPX20]|nr:zinc-ribbon domain-containing protein [Lachnospiraceae bacterium KHCPX20]